jgi:hypothetical protein
MPSESPEAPPARISVQNEAPAATNSPTRTTTDKCQVIEVVAQALKKLDVAATDSSERAIVAWTTSATAYLDSEPISGDRKLLESNFSQRGSLISLFLDVAANQTVFHCEGQTPSVIWADRDRMNDLWERQEETWRGHLARLEPRAAGLGGFSDVAFSADRHEALVYAFLQYGDLGGEGKYWLVTKENDGWKVKQRADIWIS